MNDTLGRQSFLTGIGRNLHSERFLRAYGRHLGTIESLIVIIAALVFIIQVFLPANIFVITLVVWFVAFFTTIVFHQVMFKRIAEKELCPYQILRQLRVRSYFFKAVMLSILVFILVFYFWVSILAGKILTDFTSGKFLQGISGIMLVIEVIAVFFLVTFPLSISAYFLYLTPIQNSKKARLMFRTVLMGIALLCNEKITPRRKKLLAKYVTWFKEGLHSYNNYLYESNPARLQIIDTDKYYRNVCSIASIGYPSEKRTILNQLRLAMGCIPGRYVKDDSRRFLVALKNISNVSQQADYPSEELYKMVKPKPVLDIIADLLIPYLKVIGGLITIIAGILSIAGVLGLI